MLFTDLINSLEDLHTQLSQHASRQADQLMTYRNWLFGLYIVEFEQSGEDRAAYGQQLLVRLSEQLRASNIKGVSDRTLRQYRQFYLTYPQIWQSLTTKLEQAGLLSIYQLPIKPISSPENIPTLHIDLLLNRLSFPILVNCCGLRIP